MTTRTATPASDAPAIRAMRDALEAARTGRLEEACVLAEQALLAGGDPVPINALLGMVRMDLGDAERAIDHLEFAHQHRPSDIRIATDLASALASLGRFDRVLEVATRELAFADPMLQIARIRGAVAVQLGDLAAATEALQHVLAACPNDWESWNNLGNALSDAKDFEESAKALERALAIYPLSPETRMNYAHVLRELGRVDEAEMLYRKLAQDLPGSPLPLRQLHLMLKDSRRDLDALQAIEAAVERAPADVSLLADKANHLAALQKMSAAESVYREILAIDGSNVAGHVGLALVHELTNQVSELASLADEADARGLTDAANFIRSFHHFRKKEFEAGLAALEAVPADLEPERRLHLQGQLLDGAGRYDEAFAAFTEMNRLFSEDPCRPEERGASYRETIRNFHQTATESWAAGWRAEEAKPNRPTPVFLVGFPRSGTTLLDTILLSHSEIEVLEEEPALRTAMDLLPSFAALPQIPDEQIRAARNRYFDAVASLNPRASGKILIDKNPLTMNLLPFVRRIFPEARIILALRHPCDVVLSCFMANFRLNEGMSSFIRLDSAAELYDLSFRYYEHVQSLLPMRTHTVMYENVVADRESELRELFHFLGLDWHDAVLEHQQTALKRGRIKTASYSQVVEPIYARASGRWLNYRKHLEPVLPVLEPWAEKFGYAV